MREERHGEVRRKDEGDGPRGKGRVREGGERERERGERRRNGPSGGKWQNENKRYRDGLT